RSRQERDATLEGGNRWPKRHFGGLRIEQQRELLHAPREVVEEHGKESFVFSGTALGLFLREPIVLKGTAAIGVLLKDNLVDQTARLHAPQGQKTIRPCVR